MGSNGVKVVLIGVGGLGSASALALARGGISELVLVDQDRVELSNLARQVLYRTEDMGQPKAEVAAARLAAAFPHVRPWPCVTALRPDNAAELLEGAALVIDGLDGFVSRTVLSDATSALRIPLVHAGVLRFGGQAMTILPGRSTCYRCLLPEPPLPGVAPDPAAEGVLGPVVGLFGALQAREALGLLAGKVPGLMDRLWVADLLQGTSRVLRLVRDAACPGCGPAPRPWTGRPGTDPAPGGARLPLPPHLARPTDRHLRQVRLREVGEPGQQRLAAAAVDLPGDDAAAWTAALYLVAAGVGQVRLSGAWTGAQLADLRRIDPAIAVERAPAAAINRGRRGDPAPLLVDPAASDLFPAELGEATPEMRGAAAAARALLELLGLRESQIRR